jgi:hypothetical protein
MSGQDITDLKVERTKVAHKHFGPFRRSNYVPRNANNPDARTYGDISDGNIELATWLCRSRDRKQHKFSMHITEKKLKKQDTQSADSRCVSYWFCGVFSSESIVGN